MYKSSKLCVDIYTGFFKNAPNLVQAAVTRLIHCVDPAVMRSSLDDGNGFQFDGFLADPSGVT